MRRVFLSLTVLALLLAACGGDSGSGNPKATLSSALDEVQQVEAMTMQMSLISTTGSLQVLGEGALSEETAQKILDSSVTVSTTKGDDPSTGAAQILVNVAGNEDLELRFVDETLYVRADVRRLVETLGQDPAMIDAFVQQAAGAGMDFVQPLVDGEWISLQGLKELAGQAGAAATPGAAQQKILERLADSVESNATVTSEGSDDAGEHLVASVSLRDVYEDLQSAASELGPLPPGGLPNAQEVPDERIDLDLWVDDGRLAQVEFDFLQLRDIEGSEIPDGVEQLALRIALSDFSGDVEVPEGAVPVDLGRLLQGIMGGTASGAGAASGYSTAP